MNILEKFNLSYSAYSTYKKSQLQFYFQYLTNEQPTPAITVYGDAGNVVHNSVEDYIKTNKNNFDYHWNKYKIDEQYGINNVKLNKTAYKNMFIKAVNYVKTLNNNHLIVEKQFNFKAYNINIKGFIDLIINYAEPEFIDWKTNSKSDYNMHKDQRLFYSWAWWKMFKVIPMCNWIYLKTGQNYVDKFTKLELKRFDIEIMSFIIEIKLKGLDPYKYLPGEYKNLFNGYKSQCQEIVDRKINQYKQNIIIQNKGYYCFLKGTIDPKLEQGIDFATRFDLPEKYWMQRASKFKNVNDIGTIHLYNSKFKNFPSGLLDKVKKIIIDYANYYKKDVNILMEDLRNQDILNQDIDMPAKLNTNKILRDYQEEAVSIFMNKSNGILKLPTGSGKTFIGAEIIRRCKSKILWIIDRKELMNQTIEELTILLNKPIGVINGQMFEIQDITVATIQTLNINIINKKYIDYLQSINMVVIDEFHKAATDSYKNIMIKTPNLKYKLGLTATPTRDDGKAPILFSIIGDIIYSKTSKELQEQGYLVKPSLYFYSLPYNVSVSNIEYTEDYNLNVVENEFRNNLIKKLIKGKTLILVKNVKHGKLLSELLEVPYLYGSLTKIKREEIFDKFRNTDSNLIMTLSIGAEGLDIPNLDTIINAGANKGDVKSIQILGRVLRTFKNKSNANYIDFIDVGKYTYQHSQKRMNTFKDEGYEIEVKE